MKYPVILLAAVFLFTSAALAVDVTAIDAVRGKTAFSEADAGVIGQFVQATVTEMLDRTEFANVSQTRDTFITRLDASAPNAKYRELLVAAAEKHFKQGFAEADKQADAERKKHIKVNLLIMLEKIGQVASARAAADQFADQDTGVRYWAVKCVTNPEVVTRFNAGGQGIAETAQDVTSRLKAMIPAETSANILDRVVDYCIGVTAIDTTELLTAIANKRAKGYEDWTQEYELLDGKLLNALGKKVKGNKAAAAAFGQLLSDCMQKYAKHMASSSQSPLLGEQQADYLATTLMVVERGALNELTGRNDSGLQAAMSKGAAGVTAMNGEYALFFGSAGSAGELAKVLGVKYKDAQGKDQDMPRPLPDKPGTVKK
jgi:hypothetical protein